jgi:hypothetical protein
MPRFGERVASIAQAKQGLEESKRVALTYTRWRLAALRRSAGTWVAIQGLS